MALGVTPLGGSHQSSQTDEDSGLSADAGPLLADISALLPSQGLGPDSGSVGGLSWAGTISVNHRKLRMRIRSPGTVTADQGCARVGSRGLQRQDWPQAPAPGSWGRAVLLLTVCWKAGLSAPSEAWVCHCATQPPHPPVGATGTQQPLRVGPPWAGLGWGRLLPLSVPLGPELPET